MITNPAAAMRMLIIYAICIPLAIIVGYLLTDPLNYGTLGFLGLVIALIISPIFIKWHYPIMVFGLGCPIYVFFLKGNPPCWEVVVMLSLGIAIVERALSSERRFIRVPSMTWPLIYLIAMAVMTAQLTGGIGLHQLGGSVGGGQKYLVLFLGVGAYFALSSRAIPLERRGLYVALFFLAGTPALISNLYPVLPGPLKYINLLFPPQSAGSLDLGTHRLGAFGASATCIANYMLARYGLRGILAVGRPGRLVLFVTMFLLTFVGGFRDVFVSFAVIMMFLFFMEGLHRTRLLLVFVMIGILGGMLLFPMARHLPFTFQRALTVVPGLNLDPAARMDAEGSSEWRLKIWQALWPKVPQYLLLGKGYALTAGDFEMMGQNSAFSGAAAFDPSNESLAVSGDYHSGPLSTLIPFGVWGAIAILWLMGACLRVCYRNWKYGDAELRTVNAFILVGVVWHVLSFFFIFGAFANDVQGFAVSAGFCVALNGGVRGPVHQRAAAQRIKPLAELTPQTV